MTKSATSHEKIMKSEISIKAGQIFHNACRYNWIINIFLIIKKQSQTTLMHIFIWK